MAESANDSLSSPRWGKRFSGFAGDVDLVAESKGIGATRYIDLPSTGLLVVVWDNDEETTFNAAEVNNGRVFGQFVAIKASSTVSYAWVFW